MNLSLAAGIVVIVTGESFGFEGRSAGCRVVLGIFQVGFNGVCPTKIITS
jgi:hypothetical protein